MCAVYSIFHRKEFIVSSPKSPSKLKSLLLISFLFLASKPFAQTTPTDSAIAVIQKIFLSYRKQSENTETEKNKIAFTNAVQSISVVPGPKKLMILVEAWMYYDPTDFPTRNLLEPVFFRYKSATLKAVNKRIKEKRKWEKPDEAPYSDLFSLRVELAK